MTRFNTVQAYINGKSIKSGTGEIFQNVYPVTGEVICEVEYSGVSEVDDAVKAAAIAQKEWRKLTGVERGRVLIRAAEILRSRNDELSKLEVWDTGKPISEANSVDVYSGADCLEYFGGVVSGLRGDHYHLGKDFAYTRREPLGVVAGIGAWNYPIQIACWKAAPALASGNAMVFKPSEMTPMTACKLAEVFKEAGLPDGLFNVVHGDYRCGKLLAEHPGIAKVSLTGSVETGKKVMQSASQTLKQVTFELGGKSPFIVFDDANIDKAVEDAILANFYTQGEICSNGTRVFVHEEVMDTFLAKLRLATEKLKIGDPFDVETTVGSLISEAHLGKVLEYIKSGLNEGARLFMGGNRVGDTGCFVEPTIFTDCEDHMKIVKEEIFGPVMSILGFNDECEVIARANDTQFGLAAGVFSENLTRAHRVAAELEAGICWINSYNLTPIEIPFGGSKQSGLGRENSLHAIEHYTQLKTVYVGM